MRIVMSLLLVASASMASIARADTEQERLMSCTAQAAQLHVQGDDRQGFMNQCIGGARALSPKQEKLRGCRVQAKEQRLDGDDLKAFMKACMG